MSEKNNEVAEKFVRRPSRRVRFRTSKDQKYIMLDITETWFFPAPYIFKIAENACKKKGSAESGEKPSKT